MYDVILNSAGSNPYDVIVWVDYPPVPPKVPARGYYESPQIPNLHLARVLQEDENRQQEALEAEEEEIMFMIATWLMRK